MLTAIPSWLFFIIGFGFGAIVGSFLGACAYRIPNKISLTKLTDRSSCPACDHELAAYDNIPIFAWLFLMGKCRYCKAPISIHYFLFELSAALVAGFGLVYLPVLTIGVLVLAIIIPSVISIMTAK